jgi:hypothetical protein
MNKLSRREGCKKSERGEEGNRGTKFEDCNIILLGMWRSSAEDRWYLQQMIRMDVVVWRTEQDGTRNETQHVSSSTSRFKGMNTGS